MSDHSKIEWTDATWSPVLGCSPVSAGCLNCYARRTVWRMANHPNPKISDPRHDLVEYSASKLQWTGEVRCLPEQLEVPLRWRKPRRIFVCSQADLFHPAVPDEFIAAVFGVMAACPQHQFQVLTKRAERLPRWFEWVQSPRGCAVDTWVQHCAGKYTDRIRLHRVKGTILSYPWPLPNVWLGVSVENQRAADERIPLLLQTLAAVRFISAEPLLGPVDLSAFVGGPYAGISGDTVHETYNAGIDWVIAGGESGPGARPCDLAWIRSLVQQCRAARVPCFVKQLGAAASDPPNGIAGAALKVPDEAAALISRRLRDRKGGDPAEWPEDLRVREMPEVHR